MWRLVLSRLRQDWRRSLATFSVVLFAVTSFVVLTGATTMQRVEALETAADAWRSSVDILVRPADSRTEAELLTGRVRPNFLHDIYGGITVEQWEQIAAIPGVEVAAPISMVGMIWAPVTVPVDLTDFIEPSGAQLLRLDIKTLSRGEVLPARSAYVYITDNPFEPQIVSEWITPAQISWGLFESSGPVEYVDGAPTFPCIPLQLVQIPTVHGSGFPPFNDWPTEPFDVGAWESYCISRADLAETSYVIDLPFVIPLTVAAIDPITEAQLVDLDSAVISGRFFTPDDAFAVVTRELNPELAVLLGDWRIDSQEPTATALLSASAPAADARLQATVQQLSSNTIAQLREIAPIPVGLVGRTDQMAIIAAAHPTAELGMLEIPVDQLYDAMLASAAPSAHQYGLIQACDLLRANSVNIQAEATEATEAKLTALPSPQQGLRGLYATTMSGCPPHAGYHPALGTIATTQFRSLTRFWPTYPSGPDAQWAQVAFEVVGVFDPTATMAPSGTAGVLLPLETYISPSATITDPTTATTIGSTYFRPNLNPADYLIPDVTLVIPLDQLAVVSPDIFPQIGHAFTAAPISAVRVRVADVTGWDEVSQMRIAWVAGQIAELTGLDVDSTIGSGLVAQPVTLQRGGGEPDLEIVEYWAQLGIVLNVVEQVDRKSVLLFALILASGTLTIASVAAAAAAAQRKDLGTLAEVGYRPRNLWAFLLAQQGLLGMVAGLLGALVSLPIARALGIQIDVPRAILAIPIATAIVLLAAIPSALTAARTAPIRLLTPVVRVSKRAFPMQGAISMGVITITRRPLRLVRAAIAIAIVVIALSVLVVIAWTFSGAVAGSLLGEAVILQVRTADIIAGFVLTMLGLVCLVMTLRFAHLEDQSDWATLAAVGWSPALITRAVLAQGAVVAIVGAVLGAVAALVVISGIIGYLSTAYLPPITLVAVSIGVACVLAALVPALILQRLPLAETLTRE